MDALLGQLPLHQLRQPGGGRASAQARHGGDEAGGSHDKAHLPVLVGADGDGLLVPAAPARLLRRQRVLTAADRPLTLGQQRCLPLLVGLQGAALDAELVCLLRHH